jgi:hypothetical protein
MWYDKYPGVPDRGSPLETLFVLITLQRKDVELMATRALVLGSLAQLLKDQAAAKDAIEGYRAYTDVMFPFLARAADQEKERERQQLLEHVKHPMRIDVTSILAQRAATMRSKAMAKFRLNTSQIPGRSKL